MKQTHPRPDQLDQMHQFVCDQCGVREVWQVDPKNVTYVELKPLERRHLEHRLYDDDFVCEDCRIQLALQNQLH
jgi:hypothetical protein